MYVENFDQSVQNVSFMLNCYWHVTDIAPKRIKWRVNIEDNDSQIVADNCEFL